MSTHAVSNRAPLHLHVPVPPSRTGRADTFEHLALQPAGALRRPDSACPEPGLRDMPYGFLRVLDDEGEAVGPWSPCLDAEMLRHGLRAMLLTRIFDDRMFRAQRQGRTSFYMKSAGEEAIAAAASLTLAPDDMCFPTYRCSAWLHARGYPLADLINQIYSNAADPLRGKQLPVLYSARAHGFYSLSGNVGSRFGHAVGWAMASAYKGDHRIAIAFVGEGTTAEGDFHQAATFAAVYRAPAILCITNNQYAISSFQGIAGGEQTTFAARALGYGIPGLRVDGNDFLAVHAATAWAAERARRDLGATLIEFVTYRAASHSTSDDPQRYRPPGEAAAWPLGDPIERLRAHLVRRGEWSDARHAALAAELETAVREAARACAQIGTLGESKPELREMFEGVYKLPDWRAAESLRDLGG